MVGGIGVVEGDGVGKALGVGGGDIAGVGLVVVVVGLDMVCGGEWAGTVRAEARAEWWMGL